MVVEEVVNVSGEILSEAISGIGRIALVMQALGIIVIFWVIFQVVNLLLNRNRGKLLSNVNKKLGDLEKKIDRIDRKISKK